ncbi:MAG: hypothetical protein [Caudoviricetes sp.]|nr:MAG: hypothetical protein [Caudoviricetes sp.]
MSWLRVSQQTADRLRRRWERLFARKEAFPWEVREAEHLLYKVSTNARACQLLAELLEIECDPGESVADYVSQQLREPIIARAESANLADMEEITRGFANG